MSVVEHEAGAPAPARSAARLLVSRQDEQRTYQPMGFLDAVDVAAGTEYGFHYLRRAVEAPGFRPLLGFRAARRYTSLGLFPLFAERLMDLRRPDRAEFLAALDLTQEASPLTILERSAGHRVGDGIELTPVPVADDDGRTSCLFLVHGVRHVPGSSERIDGLRAGDPLGLGDDAGNPVNPRALHVVTDPAGEVLGWVPNVLLDYVHGLREAQLTVVRANPADVGHRLRLLVRIAGAAEARWSPFDGPDWATVE